MIRLGCAKLWLLLALFSLLAACERDEPQRTETPPVAPQAAAPVAELDPEERADRWINEVSAAAEARRVAAGQSHCEAAFASLERLQTEGLSPRDEFLSGCGGLPSMAQRCLVLGYSINHRAECDQARVGLSAEDRAVLDRLINRGGS